MLSFAQLEAVLAHRLDVAADQRGTFRSRLKALQRLGSPRGVNNGRQTRVSYDAAQLLEVAFVLELLRCGLTPERSTLLVRTWWDWIRRAFLTARGYDFPVVLAFLQGDFVALDRSRDSDGRPVVTYSEDGCVILGLNPKDDRGALLAGLEILARPRIVAINVTDLMSGLTAGMRQHGIESAFLWATTEGWKRDRDELGRTLDPKGN